MNTDLLFENARLQGRVITLEAEVKCLEAVVRAHQRLDCLQVKDLNAENARLKAEVERLSKQKAVYIDNDKVLAEMEHLKAEVKEKTALIAKLHKDAEISDRESMSDEYDLNHQTKVINGLLRDKEKLQSQVERLTKAGDLLAFHYISLGRKFFSNDPLPSSVTDWNAAKEGKQP